MKYKLKIDNAIDLITNSSSELFVIKGDKTIDMVVELVNEALKGMTSIDQWSVNAVHFDSGEYDQWEEENIIEDFLRNFSDERAEKLRKIIKEEVNYEIYIDDNITYTYPEIRTKLEAIGFEHKGRC